jgi:putative GTP pyrophosphokinase
MHSSASKLRDLPDRNKTKEMYERHLPIHKITLQHLAQEIRQLLEHQGLTPAIKYRVKSFEAYYDKFSRLNCAKSTPRLATVNDFFGLRIVCPFLEDIETVSNLIATHYELTDTESKAARHSFREFGYDSLHQSIRLKLPYNKRPLPGVTKVCEIQLRTILQDAWAEVEHELVYKSDINLPNQSIRRKLASLNATLTLSDLIFQEIRDYQKEIRKHGQKRRALTVHDIQTPGDIFISHPVHSLANKPMAPFPSTLESHLEKTMMRALEAHSDHDLETAVALYKQLLGMQLDHKVRSLVYNHRGMAFFSLGNHKRALRDFSSAIKYDSENERGYSNRGLCYRVLKKWNRALQDFTKAIELSPTRPEGYYGRAQVYYDLQQYKLALEDCEKALQIQSGYLPARELIKSIQSALS